MQLSRVLLFFAALAVAAGQAASRYDVPSSGQTPYVPRPPTLLPFEAPCVKPDANCCVAAGFDAVDPMLGTYPFLEGCPKVVDAVSMCEALSRNSSIINSNQTVLPVVSYVVPVSPRFGKSSKPHKAYDTLMDINGTAPGDASGFSPPTINEDGQWTSDTDAAIVAIGTPTGCFNIYSHVTVGDNLLLQCYNDILGDPTEVLMNVFGNVAFLTAGDLNLAATPNLGSSISQAVIVGGDLEIMQQQAVAFSLTVAGAISNGPFGLFTGFGLVVLGRLQPLVLGMTELITVAMRDAGLSQAEVLDYVQVTNGETVLFSEAEVAQGRAYLAAQLCSAATQLMAPQSTGNVGEGADSNLLFQCTGTGAVCYLDLSGEQLMAASSFTLTLGQSLIAVARVTGMDPVVPALVTTGSASIIFFFTEAHSVTVLTSVGAITILPVFAPYAHTLYIYNSGAATTFAGPFVMGNPKSTTTVTFFEAIVEALDDFPELEAFGDDFAEVYICDCACNPNDLPKKIFAGECLADITTYS